MIVGAEQKSTVEKDILAGGGEMGALMRSLDWSTTAVGATETWSQSLKTAIRIMLGSRYPMFVWWGQSMTKFYNDAYISMLGQRHPQALGQPASQVWAEIWDTLGPQAEAVLEEGSSSWNEELLLIMERNGYPEETYFTFSYSPVASDDGGVGGVFCACTEDTRRVLGERRLRSLRELAAKTAEAKTVEEACEISTQTLANNPYDVPFALLYLLDDTGARARLVSTTGLAAGTLASPLEIELGLDNDICAHWLISAVLNQGESQFVEQLRSKFGILPGGAWSESPNTATVLPLTTSGQTRLSGFLIAGISPRREFDDDYKGFFDLVAGQITTALTNACAYEGERQRAEALADLDRAKTLFFSNVSHEFRTPLTLMLSPTEDALADVEAPLPPVQRERIEVVQRNGLRLLKLVNTLLDFSRIEAGRIQAVYEPTDLATFTAELASVFRSTIEQAGMQLLLECSTLPAAIFVDREMWEKIIFNLLSNAFKFTLSGTITVRLQWLETQVELTVEDTGIGILPTELPHLFERFYRVKGSQGRSFEGSGIGLALVQELVKLHGGTVNVTSVLGQGSCFRVLIPTGAAHLPSDCIDAERTVAATNLGAMPYLEEALSWLSPASAFQTAGSIAPVSTVSQPLTVTESERTPQERILLVDDNADMREYIKRFLSSRYIVQTVADGIAALADVREHPPDLVLTDVMMPRMDGFELLRTLRSDPKTQNLPIILLSARAGEESRIEGLVAGADDYLIKPFSARELMARVEASLRLAQQRQLAAQREHELRLEAEAARIQVEAVLSSISDGFLVLDRDWRYTYINNRQLEIIGKQREDVLGKIIWEVFPEIVDTEVYDAIWQAMTQEKQINCETLYTPWNRWFDVRIYPNATGISVFTTDITDRKQIEVVLRQSESQFRNMADNAPVMVRMTDATGYCTYLSHSWYNFSGQTESTGLGFGWLDVVHPDDYENAKNIFLAANQRQEAFRLEYRLRRKDGEYCWMIDAASPWYGLDGQFKGYIGSVIDITERKQVEQEREKLLVQTQAAREQAEAANRIKDEFLAVLSHELRSPLNPILGWSSLLQRSNLEPAKTSQALATIERNAKLQVQLIDDLLDISRILRGKLSLTVTQVDLSPVILAALETVRLAAEAKSLQIQTMISPSICLVNGDAGRLQQVVWNLLSNAVKFTPAEGQIVIELTQVGTNALLQVKDNGIGIQSDFLPYVFEHFRQADGATTRKFGGLGLGLAIARQIVELHGGTIRADSLGVGQGATFTVQIPLAFQPTEILSLEQPLSSTTDLSGVYVLVVDDEADSLDLITFALEQANAKVTAVSSGFDALQSIAYSVPNIVISDIGMPLMDGYMLVRQIRQLPVPQGGDIPAIALTAYAGELDQQQALKVGFQRHIAKPIEPKALVESVVALVQRRE